MLGCGPNRVTVAMETGEDFPAEPSPSLPSRRLLSAVGFVRIQSGPGPRPGHVPLDGKVTLQSTARMCACEWWRPRATQTDRKTCKVQMWWTESKACCLSIRVAQAVADSTVGCTWEHSQTPTGLIPPYWAPLEKKKQHTHTSTPSHVYTRTNSRPPVRRPYTDNSLLLCLSRSCQSRSAQNSVYLHRQSLTNTQL